MFNPTSSHPSFGASATSTAPSQSSPQASSSSPSVSIAERIRGLKVDIPFGSEIRGGKTVYLTESGLARQFESIKF